jgi:hypothetical protein
MIISLQTPRRVSTGKKPTFDKVKLTGYCGLQG